MLGPVQKQSCLDYGSLCFGLVVPEEVLQTVWVVEALVEEVLVEGPVVLVAEVVVVRLACCYPNCCLHGSC